MTVSPSSATLDALGATTRLSAVVKDQFGQTMSGAAVTWSVDNAAVATVSSSGSVTAVAVGTATISARSGSATGNASLTVRQLVSSVDVSAPAEVVHQIGATVQFTADVLDVNGHPIPSVSVTWTSSDPDCVSIDPASGLATVVAYGSVTIVAAAETESAETVTASAPLAATYLASSEHDLLSFSFLASANADLPEDSQGAIDGSDVVILVPQDVDATHLVASFSLSPNASMEIDGVQQLDAETENDFTSVLEATVIAEDGSSGTYTIYLGRLLEAGEAVGWQRDAGWFRYYSDPQDLKDLEALQLHLDSIFPAIVDTLHAPVEDTIRVDIYPSKAAFHEALRDLGYDPEDWWTGMSFSADWIMGVSRNSPDIPKQDKVLENILSLVTHEATHSAILSFGTPVPVWMHEGLASLANRTEGLVASCFPDCPQDWGFQKYVVGETGKPDLETMFFSDPAVGYAFSIIVPPFIVSEYGWDALRAFLAAPWDYSMFGLDDSFAFEARWYEYMDELWGPLVEGHPPVLPVSQARTTTVGRVAVEGTVTWQPSWTDAVFYLQDETAGLYVYRQHDPISLTEGDRVRVIGSVANYKGEFQLQDVVETTILSHGNVPDPRVVTGAEINEGQYQGELVEIQATVQTVAVLEYGNQIVVLRDAVGTDFPVYVDSRTGLAAGDWPAVGSTVQVRGVLGKDEELEMPVGIGYRLEPRRKGDLTVG